MRPDTKLTGFNLSLITFSSIALAGLLTGCGIGPVSDSTSGTLALTGRVHGGQQAISGAVMQLYTAGKTGNGSAGKAMLTKTVTTDANGAFNITGDYTCTNSTDQVYLTATGGNPGSGTNNPSLVMISALGNCGNLPTTPFIYINEVSTVAAAWALAPFIATPTSLSSPVNIGSSATNALGLKNAFLNAQLLVNTTTGNAATLPSNLTVETNKLYALADAIAPCVNSNGTSGCTPLFTAATTPSGAVPINTLNAAVDIVQNPGYNPGNVFNLINPQPPYATAFTTAPNDWTMSLTITGGGLSSPTALAIDSYGNPWVAGYYGIVSAFSPQGTPLSSTGFGSGDLAEVYGLTIGTNGNVWVSNQELPSHSPGHGSLVEIDGVASGSMGTVVLNGSSPYYYDSTVDFPTALAADSNGDILIANFANSTATVYNSSGALVSSGLGYLNSAFPVSIAADSSHGVWLANQGDTTVTHVDQSGNLLAHPSCCSGANGIAVDSYGNAWVSNYYGGNVTEVTPTGGLPTLVDGGSDGGLINGYPAGIAVDAGQNVWVADYRGTAFSEIVGNGNALPVGTALSPVNGYGLDASLSLPFAIAPDASGNVWISNYGKSNLVMFFGLATPTVTPVGTSPTAP